MKIVFRPGRKCPWYVDLRPLGGGQRFFETEKAAEKAVRQATKDRSEIGREWAELPPHLRITVVRVLREMQEAGVSLDDLWNAYKKRQLDVAKPSPSMKEAIAVLVATKRTAKLRETYLVGLEAYLNAFARGREGLPIALVKDADIREWFEKRKEAPGTMASNIGRLSSLFGFAVRRGWREKNPVDCIERPRVEGKPPQILSVRQAAKILVTAKRRHPRGLAWFTLALMAGIRPEECDRLSWESVDLKAGIVTVDAAASKVRRRRIVTLQPAALAWLKLAKSLDSELPLPEVTRRRYLRAIREKLGWDAWPQDILRHTCASYLMATWQDAGRVAAELGNSAGILLRHYRELVRREQAERFWGLIPRAHVKAAGKTGSTDHSAPASSPPA